ncbi:MAG: hypothetical protein M1834_003377 [Cirrosporium novae-zelandiae]|nr:MAG: hypothetical protein M1834_003377 [Cirrosporium novae-zelandiae]
MSPLNKTLPASWYTSSPLYQLEKRSVFSQSWYLLGPITRFINEDNVQYELAQVRLHVCKDTSLPQEPLPRALKVINSEDGTELKSHITSSGLLFTSLSNDAPDFEEYFPELEPLLAQVDFTKLPYRKSLSYEGNFNWKTIIDFSVQLRVDGYQECLHCPYTHPSFANFYPTTFYTVHNHGAFSRHIADPDKPDDGLFLFFFPICTLNVYGGGMSCFRVCPTTDPNITRMEFDYYHLEDGEAFEKYFRFVRQVALEDFELCEKAQANLKLGVYSQGILNPIKESGVAHYQQRVRKLVCLQFEIEREGASPSKYQESSSNGINSTPGSTVQVIH